jgi:hypothetical protein
MKSLSIIPLLENNGTKKYVAHYELHTIHLIIPTCLTFHMPLIGYDYTTAKWDYLY